MQKNKLYTLGYFKKRLNENGFYCTEIFKKNFSKNKFETSSEKFYSDTDKRYWTVVIDKNHKIFCTCIKTGEKCEFVFSDCKQKIKNIEYVLETDSINVIIDYLNKVLADNNG